MVKAKSMRTSADAAVCAFNIYNHADRPYTSDQYINTLNSLTLVFTCKTTIIYTLSLCLSACIF
uniref:Uncharacterized protein n=1 Tax=Anguilla anguilla TaxID=7936 RepID=A0A0E9XI76_ANGAN